MVAGLKTAISNKPPRRNPAPEITASDRAKMKIDRHALLLRGAPIAAGMSLVLAMATLAIGWSRMDRGVIIGWTAAASLLAIARLVLWARFSRRSHASQGLLAFTRWHVVAMALNGVLWGALAPLFAVSGMLGDAFLPFAIAGMTAAAIASAGASWRSVLAFNTPSLAALAATYGVLGGSDGLIIAAIIAFYYAATGYLAYSTQQMIERSIRLRSRNDNLLSALTKQVDAAHEAEARFRALIESSSDLTIIFSPEGRVVYASPAAETAFGAPPQDLYGMSTREIVHPDDLDRFRAVGGKALSTLGAVTPLRDVRLRARDADYTTFSGRLTNMLYVPGVEGFVFSGGTVSAPAVRNRLPATG
jgi:PAS domain S-box-containing protein